MLRVAGQITPTVGLALFYVNLHPQRAPLPHLQSLCFCSQICLPFSIKVNSNLSSLLKLYHCLPWLPLSADNLAQLPQEKKSTDECFFIVLSPNPSSWLHPSSSFYLSSCYMRRMYRCHIRLFLHPCCGFSSLLLLGTLSCQFYLLFFFPIGLK